MCDLSDLLMKQRRSSEALYWLEQSARNGDPRGQYVLGTWYLKRGNVQNALRWLTAAADLGSSTAQYRLGVLYLKGEQQSMNRQQVCISKHHLEELLSLKRYRQQQ